jgi:hypothetical protein
MLRWLSALLLLASACGDPSSDDEIPLSDFGVVSGPDGAVGVCCPVGVPGCSCPAPGGWAPSRSACPMSGACDYSMVGYDTDEWGCQILTFGGPSCLELPRDAGAPEDPTALGEACTAVRGCREADLSCLEPTEVVIGGPADPIGGHPDGEDTVVRHQATPEGLCTYSVPEVTDERCDPANPADPLCRDFGRCLDLLGDPTAGVCVPACTSDDECREGYVCDAEIGGCRAGCSSDDWCRIAREETNGIEGLQSAAYCTTFHAACTPADCSDAEPSDPGACADPEANFDRLVYDTESTAVCDAESARCVE